MPFRRKRTSTTRRKTFRRPRRFGFAKRVRTVVQNFVAEKKRLIVDLADGEFDWTGRRVYLDQIAQGANEGERIGRMVTPHSIVARLTLRNTETSTTYAQGVPYTVFLVQDLQTVGDGHATIGEIISDNGTALAPMGLININNKGRFKILRRWQGVLNYVGLEGNVKYMNIYHKFNKKNTKNLRYNGIGSGDIEANSLMLCFVSGSDPVLDSCYVRGVMRMWYTDV